MSLRILATPLFSPPPSQPEAHGCGVKLVAASAHQVTSDLDERHIIEHIERHVLARAVDWHFDGRVMMGGAKTVVFRS